MRLTDRVMSMSQLGKGFYVPKENKDECYNKLGLLEDIEEELGVNLITLFKANFEGVYLKEFYGKFPVMLRMGEISHTITLHTYTDEENIILKVEDYGKTWALTKEELEK